MRNLVKQYRTDSRMSQEELAKKSNVTRSYITLLEQGKRKNPSYEVMKDISIALGRTVPEVFFPEDYSILKEKAFCKIVG